MKDEDFKKIGDILETALTPIYEQLEGVDKKFEGIDKKFEGMDKKLEGMDKKLERIEYKQDAFTADMIQVQQTLGSIQDNIKIIKDQNQRELREVRKFVGMPTNPID